MQHLGKKPKLKGFVTLLSVLILGVVATIIANSALSITTDTIISASAYERSKQAKALADSCAEVAIDRLKLNTSYVGNEVLSLPFGSCTISTITGTGNTNRVFQASSTISGYTKKVSITITQVNPTTSISAWTEIP